MLWGLWPISLGRTMRKDAILPGITLCDVSALVHAQSERKSTGLTVEQPLRAESGTGTFRVENGQGLRTDEGFTTNTAFRLRPDARELRMTLAP